MTLVGLGSGTSIHFPLHAHSLISDPQTLKILRQVEVINFGDCLVRSRGALAIAEAVKEGLHRLKVGWALLAGELQDILEGWGAVLCLIVGKSP